MRARRGARVAFDAKTSLITRDGINSGPGAALPFSLTNAASSSASLNAESDVLGWKAHDGSMNDKGSSGVKKIDVKWRTRVSSAIETDPVSVTRT
jgi:hypothetical protein